MNTNISVSVIMPALNEEKAIKDAIEATISAFKKYAIDGEIIAVNDGSTDNTRNIVLSLIQTYGRMIRLLDHVTPKGMGASFWDGVKLATKDAVTLNPGDNENDQGEILRYVGLLEYVDMVVPFVYNKEVRPTHRRILSTLFCFILNITFRTSFNYTNGTAIYRRSVLGTVECKSSGFLFLAEILMKIVRQGYLFIEVPYALSTRSSGASKAITLKSLLKVIINYLNLVKNIYFSDRYKFNAQLHIRRA